ncbi:hypothetical protein PCA31118_03926 [Pandoraea captiosa]|uniref:Uncharacterized protein n=1 Tax=Pandoraea captiosa TaxID=2508302 RepID=A0A5E5AGK2_9BURK|nr:DUF6387 family protein [Pandoraea captiosa]VVE71623.1 hypothetical protein PCA31118_03926 [Pandoraea captiosa]
MSELLIQDSDLDGFALEKYLELEHFTYTQWRDLILHRALLWDLASEWKEQFKGGADPISSHWESVRLDANERGLGDAWTTAKSRFSLDALRTQIAAIVTALLHSPLHQAFTLPEYVESGNLLATASIRLRPQPYAGDAPLRPDEFNAALFGALDDVPLAQAFESTSEPHRVLLEVDVDVPNEQLVADFRRWLRAWRQVTGGRDTGIRKIHSPDWIKTSIGRWLDDGLVAYIDLKVVSKFLRRDFPKGRLARALGFDEYQWDSAEERLENYVQEFFGPTMRDWMYFLSFDEEWRVGAKKRT